MSQVVVIAPPSLNTELQEEIGLTFQVAMIASDGLIVGSDRRQIYFQAPTSEQQGSIQPSSDFKFIENLRKSVICAQAGSSHAKEIARAIIQCEPEGKDEFAWQDAVLKAARSVTSEELRSGVDEIIVVRPDNPRNALLITRHTHHQPTLMTITEQVCTGIHVPARFIPLHFWHLGPVDELYPLALLALSFASAEDKNGIGAGFDILTVKANGAVIWNNYRDGDVQLADTVQEFKTYVSAYVSAIQIPKFDKP